MADLVNHIERIARDDGLDAVWEWASSPQGAHSKAKRFDGCVRWARRRQEQARKRGDVNAVAVWRDRANIYRTEREKWESRYENRKDVKWPEKGTFAEALYHAPGPHIHLASSDRAFLLAIAKIGAEKFNLRIAEFPPFEDVEPVHVDGSWHYRAVVDGEVRVLSTSDPRLKKGGSGGLAFDANDADGGSDEEYAFWLEVRERYL